MRSGGVEEVYAYGVEGLAAQRTIASGTPQPLVYPLLDGQASVRHLTDASGNLVLSRRYDALGSVQQTSGSASTLLGYTGELHNGALVYLRARWYNTVLGTFTTRDSFPGVPTRPQSLHRYTYTENNPVNRTDPSGHLTGAPPCNLLPNRPESCTWEDIERWWQSDDGEQARQMGAAVARTPYDAIVGFWDFIGQLGSDPRGAINGAIYGTLNAPYQIGGDLTAGMLCNNPQRLGRAIGNSGMIYVAFITLSQNPLNDHGLSSVGDRIYGLKDTYTLETLGQFSTDIDITVGMAAQRLEPLEGYYDIVSHGTPNSLQMRFQKGPTSWDWVNEWWTADQVAEFIKARSNYSGEPIRLVACSTGACPTGFAQQLADKLGVDVIAPTDLTRVDWKTGEVIVLNDGTMKRFYPGGSCSALKFCKFSPTGRWVYDPPISDSQSD